MKHKIRIWKYLIYYNFLRYLVYLRKMDKKSAKIIYSNLRHVTKALHVPKRGMCSKCEFASKQWNVLRHDMHPKSLFASEQWNVRKWNKELSKNEVHPLIKI